MEAASRMIASVIEPGNLAILDSTVPPSTCRKVVAAIIRGMRQMVPENDYLLAHAPKQLIPGAIL